MYCPSSIILDSRIVFITLHTKCDYLYSNQIPAREKLNLLRYEFIIAPFSKRRKVINKDGMWAVRLSNFIFNIKRRYTKNTWFKVR